MAITNHLGPPKRGREKGSRGKNKREKIVLPIDNEESEMEGKGEVVAITSKYRFSLWRGGCLGESQGGLG